MRNVSWGLHSAGLKSAKSKKGTSDPHLIPPDTRVDVKLEPNEAAHCVDLLLKTTTYTVIQLVSVFNDQIFEGESLVTVRAAPLHPPRRASHSHELLLGRRRHTNHDNNHRSSGAAAADRRQRSRPTRSECD